MRHEIIEAIIAMFNVCDKKSITMNGVLVSVNGDNINLTATNSSTVCHRLFEKCDNKETDIFKEKNFITIGNKDFLKALLKEHKKEEIPSEKLLGLFTVNNDFPAMDTINEFFRSPELVTKKVNADLIIEMAKSISNGKGKDKHHIELSFLENGFFKAKGLNSLGLIAPLR